jgi:hypothetical protein
VSGDPVDEAWTQAFAARFAQPREGEIVGLVAGIAYMGERAKSLTARRVETPDGPVRIGSLRALAPSVSPNHLLSALADAGRDAEISDARTAMEIPTLPWLSASQMLAWAKGRSDPMAWARAQIPPEGPKTTDRHLFRLMALPFVRGGHDFRILASLPEAWIPRDNEEISAFRTLSAMLRTTVSRSPGHVALTDPALAVMLGGYGFLSTVKGRWVDFVARLGRDADTLRTETNGTCDMAVSFAREVVVPTLFRAGLCSDRYDVHAWTAVTAIAARVLFEGKALHAILAESAAWHRVSAAYAASIAEGGASWPRPFDVLAAPNGCVMTCIGDARSLADEGLAMSHCVGTYAPACRSARSVIVSVKDPSGERLSTLDLTPRDGAFVVAQNLGRHNARPPPEAIEAAAWLAAHLGPVADPAWAAATSASGPGTAADPCDGTALAAARERWAPFLRRPLRERSALDAAILRAGVHVLRTRHATGEGVGADGSINRFSLDWERTGGGFQSGDLSAEAWMRMRVPGLPKARRDALGRAAPIALLALPVLALAAILLPLVPFLGREALLASLLGIPATFIGVRFASPPWAARAARHLWERRALRLAGRLDPSPARMVTSQGRRITTDP